MTIRVSKFVALCTLRLLRIFLEKAMCFVSYLMGLTTGALHVYEAKSDNPGQKDSQESDNNQTRPPFR